MDSDLLLRQILIALSLAIAYLEPPAARGATQCAECHPSEVAGYEGTPMAHSLGMPGGEPSGAIFDAKAKTRFRVRSDHSRIIQQIEGNGISAEYAAAYSIGSGTHGTGYVIELWNNLFLSPLAYYRGRGWDLAPGFENFDRVDFYRPVEAECLLCHSGEPRPVPGTVNTYESPPFASQSITCGRCHGPSEGHLRRPAPGSIINPAKLPPRARDSVCEQCHLQGEARITNPGMKLSDFRPGHDLEEAYTVYVLASKGSSENSNALRVISQSQQLALSRCSQSSQGRLWCGTCHDPHHSPPDFAASVRSQCLSCHAALTPAVHSKADENCVACHMPRLPTVDGSHTAFTNHRIAVYRTGKNQPHLPPQSAESAVDALVPWHDPPAAFAQRNLAIAEVRVALKLKDFILLNQGYKRLRACVPQFSSDPLVLATLGPMFMASGNYPQAKAVDERLIEIEPRVAVNYLQAGLLSEAAHDDLKAIAYMEKALQLDPLMRQAYWELKKVFHAQGDAQRERQIMDQYFRSFPEHLEPQLKDGAMP
jgi:tetratricopeptide (TPR) repeat protein